jgi:hypothetical protein
MKTYLVIAFTLLANSCSDEPKERILVTDHFNIYYTSYDDSNIQEVADHIESHYSRITTHLQSGDLTVDIKFYKDISSLKSGSGMANLPSYAIGLATSATKIHMLAPNAPGQTFNQMLQVLVHEFAHCVALKINPGFGNNPRWLWESVALYEAQQFNSPGFFEYMVNKTPPTLAELNSFQNTYVYDIGYLFAEFIIETWGDAKFRELIIANGNIGTALGITPAEFHQQWFDFVIDRYDL